jgi:TolA-binding protein
MISLEQVMLLESRVTNTIEYVKKVTGENSKLKEKLSSYQVRIEELEAVVNQFKENQSRIEEGILSALDRLNQFEDALESKLSADSKLSTDSKLSVKGKPLKEEKTIEIEELSSPDEESSPEELSSPRELDIF